jgi:hypothetical protein
MIPPVQGPAASTQDQLVDGAGFASLEAVGWALEGGAAAGGALAGVAGFGALAGLAGLVGLAGVAVATFTGGLTGTGVANADFISGVSLHREDWTTA